MECLRSIMPLAHLIFPTGRRIGLSLQTRVVAGSSPAFGSTCRSSSVVEHVNSQFVSYPSVLSAGRRSWVIGNWRLAVQIRLRVSARIAQSGRATVLPKSPPCPLVFQMGRSHGLSPVIGSTPICSTKWGSSSVERAASARSNPKTSLAHLFSITPVAVIPQPQPQPGDRMAHNPHDQHDLNFEFTSKRRKGFPSETRVKRGVQIVHGNKELQEKLGRNDLCPCGSGRSF